MHVRLLEFYTIINEDSKILDIGCDNEPTRWKEKDIKGIVGVAVRAILSLFWRKLVHIRTPIDDDGKFLYCLQTEVT